MSVFHPLSIAMQEESGASGSLKKLLGIELIKKKDLRKGSLAKRNKHGDAWKEKEKGDQCLLKQEREKLYQRGQRGELIDNQMLEESKE